MAVVAAVAVVGSGALSVVCWMLEAAGEVSTSVLPLALDLSASQSAEAVPATAAITSASSAGQTQSPGYQPSRLRHPEPSRAISPSLAGSRAPHSRQYSCAPAYGVLQRGHSLSGSGALKRLVFPAVRSRVGGVRDRGFLNWGLLERGLLDWGLFDRGLLAGGLFDLPPLRPACRSSRRTGRPQAAGGRSSRTRRRARGRRAGRSSHRSAIPTAPARRTDRSRAPGSRSRRRPASSRARSAAPRGRRSRGTARAAARRGTSSGGTSRV